MDMEKEKLKKGTDEEGNRTCGKLKELMKEHNEYSRVINEGTEGDNRKDNDHE